MNTHRTQINQMSNIELKKLIFGNKKAEIRINIQKSRNLVDKIRAEGSLKERNLNREKVVELLSENH